MRGEGVHTGISTYGEEGMHTGTRLHTEAPAHLRVLRQRGEAVVRVLQVGGHIALWRGARRALIAIGRTHGCTLFYPAPLLDGVLDLLQVAKRLVGM